MLGRYDVATNNMVHKFSYFGVPNEFKIIIQKSNGDILVSNLINTTEFDEKVYIDMSDMTVNQQSSYTFSITKSIICASLTIIIELIVAYIFKIKNDTGYIIITNIISQIILTVFLIFMTPLLQYILAFVIGEIIVFLLEYILYKNLLKKIENKTILIYVIIANTVTAGLTFLI